MPVQTFTSFVTEQAVGIAIGAVAVVAARKLGPKLATATQTSRPSGAGTVPEKLGAALVTIVPVVVAKPVKMAGQALYEQVAGSVQRYGEQWQELLAEAQAGPATSVDDDGLCTADILAGLLGAKVVSDLRGRLRLRLSPLQRDDQLAACSAALTGLPGIHQVQINRHSGSVLIRYDPGQYASSDSLCQALAASYVRPDSY